MFAFNCNCKSSCTEVSVIASIFVGIVTAFLTIMGIVAVTPAFLWVLFGIAVVYLAVILVTTARNYESNLCRCIRQALSVIFTGILGTVLTSVILLAFSFAATSIIGAIITGALLTFFSLILTSTVCLINCLSNCD